MSRSTRPEHLPTLGRSLSVTLRPQRYSVMHLTFPLRHDLGFAAAGVDLWLSGGDRPGAGRLKLVGRGARLPEWVSRSVSACYGEGLIQLSLKIESAAAAFDRHGQAAGIDLPFVTISASEWGQNYGAVLRFGGVGAGTAAFRLLKSGAVELVAPTRQATVGEDGKVHPMTLQALFRNREVFGEQALAEIDRVLRPVAERELRAFSAIFLALPTSVRVLR